MLRKQQRFFSEYGEDRLLFDRLFSDYRCGNFVEIGAGDGISPSASYFFERELGWSGICTEPSPEQFSKLKENRSALTLNVCLGLESKVDRYLWVSGTSDSEGALERELGTIQRERWLREVQTAGWQVNACDVPVLTWAELLGQGRIHQVDLLILQTRALELSVLRDFPWAAMPIPALVVENRSQNGIQRMDILRHGYRLEATMGTSDIFLA